MKIVKDEGVFRKTTEYEYTPTPLELYWWYSGTNAGFTRDNPYANRSGEVTRRVYRKEPTL